MIRSQKSRLMLLVSNVMEQIKWVLKLIVVLLGLRAQKALFTPANYCINDFILIRFYKIVVYLTSFTRVLNWPTYAKKGPIYTRTS
jgi:hypothetical protein